MDQATLLDSIRLIIIYSVVPVFTAVTWLVRRYIMRVEELHTRQTAIDIRMSVVEAKIDDIRDDVRGIREGIEKLAGRRKIDWDRD